jgi:hypothetical protein
MDISRIHLTASKNAKDDVARKLQKRSLKREALSITVVGTENIVHILPPENYQVVNQYLKENEQLIAFGSIGQGNKALKVYAFKNCRELVFIRIGDEFLCLNRFKLKELKSLVTKGAWYIGANGRRTRKYD